MRNVKRSRIPHLWGRLRSDKALEKACSAYAYAFISMLEQNEVWPRPRGIAWSKIGTDYIWHDINSLQETHTACSELVKYEDLQRMYADPKRSHEADEFRCVLRPFGERVAAYIAAGWSPKDALRRWYRSLIQEVTSTEVIPVVVHGITGINSKLERIPLDGTSSLERIGGSRTDTILGPYVQAPVDNLSLQEVDGWSLVSQYRVPKQGNPSVWRSPRWEDQNRLSALMTTLSLLIRGAYRQGLHLQFELGELPVEDPSVYQDHPLFPDTSTYEITVTDARRIRRLFLHLLSEASFRPGRETPLPRQMQTVLFHFGKTSDETFGWTETAMECVIALEVLFGAQPEQRFRLATRAALLLGRDDDEVKRIYRQVRGMYDARSFPAHGKEVEEAHWRQFYKAMTGTNMPREANRYDDLLSTEELDLLQSATEDARDLTRRAILACLRLQDSPDPELKWPFVGDLEDILYTEKRKQMQRLAKIRSGISF